MFVCPEKEFTGKLKVNYSELFFGAEKHAVHWKILTAAEQLGMHAVSGGFCPSLSRGGCPPDPFSKPTVLRKNSILSGEASDEISKLRDDASQRDMWQNRKRRTSTCWWLEGILNNTWPLAANQRAFLTTPDLWQPIRGQYDLNKHMRQFGVPHEI